MLLADQVYLRSSRLNYFGLLLVEHFYHELFPVIISALIDQLVVGPLELLIIWIITSSAVRP